ncbi:hypothetical protein [Desulfomicrobium norvegicum]|nr:hypothetical protein [Desulfomicrobium norvegicum]
MNARVRTAAPRFPLMVCLSASNPVMEALKDQDALPAQATAAP